jgi:hypothetical protein
VTTRCRGWVDTRHPEARFATRPETGTAIFCLNRQACHHDFMRHSERPVIKIKRTVIIAANMPNSSRTDVSTVRALIQFWI